MNRMLKSTSPGIALPVRLTRWRLFAVACAALLCCSCQGLSPRFPSPRASSPRGITPPGMLGSVSPPSVPGAQAAATPAAAPHGLVSTDRSGSVSAGAKIVTPQEINARRQASFPVAQVGYFAPVAPVPHQPLQQVSHVAAARPADRHSCAACQPNGSYPPALPAMPHGGDAAHWSKPWQYGHWPSDEYICNGGDNDLSVQVADDWSVIGLHEGDTIAHYDTLEGEVVVEPTNEVCLYAPRFASVRRVTGVVLHEQHLRSAGLELPVQLAQSGEAETATTVLQPVQPGRNLAISSANRFRDKMRPGGLENRQAAGGAVGGFLPFEDFLIIRTGRFDNSEKARLSEHLQAAYTWSHDASVQVVLDHVDVLEISSEVGMQSVFTYQMPDGKPRLRVVKVASKQNAQPGETVDFTIRFDNVGDRVIGNVTVIDNLNTRLEYVPDSQECTLDAGFTAPDNEHESSVLRWEITEPMKVGTGGVIRFQCRVR